MLQGGSISGEVQRVTVALKELFLQNKLKTNRQGRWVKAGTSYLYGLGRFPGITALANMQYINVSLL